jgi:segregation and condensation protein B
MPLDTSRLRSILESLIFVSEQPVSFRKLRTILEGVPPKELKQALDELVEEYRRTEHGITIEPVAEGYQMRTRPENQEWVKMLVQFKPVRLSKAAMETQAIIAYRQPITKTEIESIRGVDCSSALASLFELSLIKILGRKEIPGRPFIYGTTPEFLEIFNLKSLDDLPSLREIEDLDPAEVEHFARTLAESGEVETTDAEPGAQAIAAEPEPAPDENEPAGDD